MHFFMGDGESFDDDGASILQTETGYCCQPTRERNGRRRRNGEGWVADDAITAEERGLLIGGRFPARVSCIAELGVPRDTETRGRSACDAAGATGHTGKGR